MNQPTATDPEVNELLSGLKLASSHGATDIPSDCLQPEEGDLARDSTARCDYVPAPSHSNYIDVEANDQEHIQYKQTRFEEDSINELYFPVLLAILYFFFQLPFFKKFILGLSKTFDTPIPSGNYSLLGVGFVSLLFGFMYYVFAKIQQHYISPVHML